MKISNGRLHPERSATLLAGFFLIAFHSACNAPPSVPLEGGPAGAIAEGIASGTQSLSHDSFDRFVAQHVREGGARFDYLSASENPGDLEAYLAAANEAALSDLSRDHLLALLINTYNACTIRAILETFIPDPALGVASIRDIPRVFDRKSCKLGGHTVSLNNIEHNLIRPLFRDPRIHFAVNCASVGCPPLSMKAFTGEALESQLEAAARRTLASEAYVRVEDGTLQITRLLEWYGADFLNEEFVGSEASLPAYVRKYASPEVGEWINSHRENPKIEFLDYDWSLNLAR